MKKGLLLPLLIPLIAFAAVKGYFWFQVKRVVDQVVEQAAPFMTIEYGAIETSFKGAAGIHDVRIYPKNDNYPVRIASIWGLSDDWIYFMKLGTPLDQGDLPKQLVFEINGLDIDLNAPYADLLRQYSTGLYAPFSGCEQSDLEGIALLKRLGYSSLYTDLRLEYLFSPESEYLTLSMDMAAHNSFSMSIGADMDLGVTALVREQLKQLQPKLGGLSIRYKDDSYHRKHITYCAELNAESPTEFVDRHVALTATRYRQLGFSFNQALIDAYREFLSGSSEAKLTLTAQEAVVVPKMMLKSPAEQLQGLDLRLDVNGAAVTPLELSWQQPELALATTRASQDLQSTDLAVKAVPEKVSPAPALPASQTPVLAVTAVESSIRAVMPEQKFRVTDLGELRNLVGSKAKVDTRNGHHIEGEIIRVLRNSVLLRQSLEGGVAELPIVFNHIARIRVLR